MITAIDRAMDAFSIPLKKAALSALAIAALAISGCNHDASYKAENILRHKVLMDTPVISADNKFLAASYTFKGAKGKWGIFLYDIETDKISHLPLDNDYFWTKPVFFPDGKYLAVLKLCGMSCADKRKGQWLTLIDLEADEPNPKPITTEDVYQTVPAFSPDGKWVAWFERNYFVAEDDHMLVPSGKGLLIKKKNLETGVIKIVYEDAEQKGWGGRMFYLSDTEILAHISGSDNAKHELHIRDGVDGMLAVKRPGMELFAKLDDYPNYDGSGSGRIAFIGSNDVWDPEQNSTPSDQYDLYIYEQGEIRRVTNEKTIPNGMKLSPDGRTAVIMGRENGSNDAHDVWIVDVETGNIRKQRVNCLDPGILLKPQLKCSYKSVIQNMLRI